MEVKVICGPWEELHLHMDESVQSKLFSSLSPALELLSQLGNLLCPVLDRNWKWAGKCCSLDSMFVKQYKANLSTCLWVIWNHKNTAVFIKWSHAALNFVLLEPWSTRQGTSSSPEPLLGCFLILRLSLEAIGTGSQPSAAEGICRVSHSRDSASLDLSTLPSDQRMTGCLTECERKICCLRTFFC